jgi:hypothetical protein
MIAATLTTLCRQRQSIVAHRNAAIIGAIRSRQPLVGIARQDIGKPHLRRRA